MAFRRALGTFVTGVTIVTTLDTLGRPAGLTANSFNSVSLDPPMVLWSLALDSTSLPAFRQAGWWAVHVLAADQEALSNRFAQRDTAKFDGLPTQPGPGRHTAAGRLRRPLRLPRRVRIRGRRPRDLPG